MFWVSRARRLPLVLALLVGLIVLGVVVGHTHGAKPHADATYAGTVYVENAAGHVTQKLPISLTVDRSGQRVQSFRFPGGLPRACVSRAVDTLTARSGSAVLMNPSHFEINLAITGTAGRVGTLELSGIFHSLNRESGAVATRYSARSLHGCDASGGYTTKTPLF